MLFNSIEFLIFFPVVTVLFFVLPHRLRWFLLLAASCFFYSYFIPVYILILFVTIIVDYFAGILIERSEGIKRKYFLILSIVVNIGFLCYFKYYNFFIDNVNQLFGLTGAEKLDYLNIVLPIGLSFHTFQALSYTIEVYRGKFKAERHFGLYALYVMFYPQLVAGPIERPQNVLPQFHLEMKFSQQNLVAGLQGMLWGLFKKVVIADRLAMFTDPVFNQPEDYPALTLIVAVVFFSFQIYCDFSGYSDIALGAARTMGFRLMKNFDMPYFSGSISEFWKRWHISLSTWFRDYIYISLGGNRVGIPRWYFNLLFVFLVSGLWHGANWTFIVWGGLHGIYLVLAVIRDQYLIKQKEEDIGVFRKYARQAVNVFFTFVLVAFAWIFFRANSLEDAFYIIEKIGVASLGFIQSTFQYQGVFDSIRFVSPVYSYEFILSIFFTFLLIAIEAIHRKYNVIHWLGIMPRPLRWMFYYLLIFFILFFGITDNREFIYFQF